MDGEAAIQHVTFHLADSLPKDVLRRMEDNASRVPEHEKAAELRRQVEKWVDAGHGACLLREPAAAELVQESLKSFDGIRYWLLAWVVMPNHVHVLFQPMEGWMVGKIVASWKSFTGRRLSAPAPAGSIKEGRVWHREYWDRYMRDGRHLEQTLAYIHGNPVKAGLVRLPGEWRWSSAFEGDCVKGDNDGAAGD